MANLSDIIPKLMEHGAKFFDLGSISSSDVSSVFYNLEETRIMFSCVFFRHVGKSSAFS